MARGSGASNDVPLKKTWVHKRKKLSCANDELSIWFRCSVESFAFGGTVLVDYLMNSNVYCRYLFLLKI